MEKLRGNKENVNDRYKNEIKINGPIRIGLYDEMGQLCGLKTAWLP